ncbi:MAG: DUF393 domain-containing protein [Planctomycetaceae bacterium]|nr:DUF393 domain-containing protein [Planctomycetaceae bacterium]
MTVSAPASADTKTQPVLLFDGVCGLCNSFVDFIMKRDRQGHFLFSPLQGEFAADHTTAEDREQLKTVVLVLGDRTYRRSAAVVRVLWQMGFPWSLCGTMLWLIPQPLRDLGYKMVSRSRYRLFGKKESCRLPTREERARFLD